MTLLDKIVADPYLCHIFRDNKLTELLSGGMLG